MLWEKGRTTVRLCVLPTFSLTLPSPAGRGGCWRPLPPSAEKEAREGDQGAEATSNAASGGRMQVPCSRAADVETRRQPGIQSTTRETPRVQVPERVPDCRGSPRTASEQGIETYSHIRCRSSGQVL